MTSEKGKRGKGGKGGRKGKGSLPSVEEAWGKRSSRSYDSSNNTVEGEGRPGCLCVRRANHLGLGGGGAGFSV